MVIVVIGLMILTSREKIVLSDPTGTHSPYASPRSSNDFDAEFAEFAEFSVLELGSPRDSGDGGEGEGMELGSLGDRRAGGDLSTT